MVLKKASVYLETWRYCEPGKKWYLDLLSVPVLVGFWPSFRLLIRAIQGMQSRESNSPNGSPSKLGFLHSPTLNPPCKPTHFAPTGAPDFGLSQIPISSNLLLVLVIQPKVCSKHRFLLIGSSYLSFER